MSVLSPRPEARSALQGHVRPNMRGSVRDHISMNNSKHSEESERCSGNLNNITTAIFLYFLYEAALKQWCIVESHTIYKEN